MYNMYNSIHSIKASTQIQSNVTWSLNTMCLDQRTNDDHDYDQREALNSA